MSASRIDTVVRVRRLQERVARGGVLVARGAATEAATARAAALHAVERAAAGAPAAARELPAHRRLVDRGVREVVEAGRAVVVAGHRVDSSLDAWADANRRLDGVQRLADRRAAAARVELERRTLADIDDLTVTRWARAAPRSSDGADPVGVGVMAEPSNSHLPVVLADRSDRADPAVPSDPTRGGP